MQYCFKGASGNLSFLASVNTRFCFCGPSFIYCFLIFQVKGLKEFFNEKVPFKEGMARA
jgi:hypothetical protein